MKKEEKRGQFYLIATMIIIVLVGGLIVVSNYSKDSSNAKFNHLGKELSIESGHVIDYGIKNSKNLKILLNNFTRTYVTYSDAEDLYFLYGNKSEITVMGYKRLTSGKIFINAGSGDKELDITKGIITSKDFLNPAKNIKITVDSVGYNFTLEPGENFYFIISREINGDKYIIRN